MNKLVLIGLMFAFACALVSAGGHTPPPDVPCDVLMPGAHCTYDGEYGTCCEVPCHCPLYCKVKGNPPV